MNNIATGMQAVHFSQEVTAAKKSGAAIVALESTIVTHGMPWPSNIETARVVEEDIRSQGAVPATIAVMGGKIHVGLEPDQLEQLAKAKNVMKLSRADLAVGISTKHTGSTTVAATMICANLAGISVFATGGVGGVHRGASESFDISADLEEFSKTPVTVVAAGVKAILDMGKTLEVLETHGVPVIGFRTNEFPAFWSRTSGLQAPLRLDSAEEIAGAHLLRAALGIAGGQLIANPIPAESEIPQHEINPHIVQALGEAKEQNIAGKEVTPFLLQRIYELTEGASLEANIALVRNNAKLAAQIAKALLK